MKKCPFCKAQIEDNARFCLYCMKPLNSKEEIYAPEQKKTWWLLVAILGLLTVALVVILLTLGRSPEKPAGSAEGDDIANMHREETQSSEPTESTTGESGEETATQDTLQQVEGTTEGEDEPPKTAENTPVTSDPVRPEQSEQPPATIDPLPEPTEDTNPEPTEEVTQQITEATQPPTAESTQPQPSQSSQVVYTYRAARAGDEYSAQYQNTGNDIVITGVAEQSASGVYDVPEYIDGKKVIAIVANAFYGSNAKVVYVPATVRAIWNYAFNGCPLTDIYFRGKAVYTEGMAFERSASSAGLTIHCAADCHDRNLRYYKNSASAYYDANWEEWNG